MTSNGKPTGPSSLAFFSRLRWLDGTPLLDHIEEYRRQLFTAALDSFDKNGRPLYSMVVAGRGKKNAKSLDLILAALFVLTIRRSVQGSDGYILANDGDQAGDDLALARKLVGCNPILSSEIEALATELRLRDGSAALKILPARDTVGAHGKSAAFIGYDEIWAYRDWSLLEALQPDPTRADTLQWITSYASLYATGGAPLHDLMQIGKAGTDKRMLFSWYSGDYTSDPAFAALPPLERANPSMTSWPDGMAYLESQRVRLPTGRFRRLHLNLPGSPEGAAFDQGRVLACIVQGRRSLPPEPDRAYRAHVDLSGGSSDDATMAIAHLDGRVAVIDLVVKQIGGAPFDPRSAVSQFTRILKEYGVSKVTGDAYGGQTFRLDFERDGITYDVVSKSASFLYEQLEPRINTREIELPDHTVLIEQLVSLIWRGGKITHEAGGHDDHVTAVAGVVAQLFDRSGDVPMVWPVLVTAPRNHFGEVSTASDANLGGSDGLGPPSPMPSPIRVKTSGADALGAWLAGAGAGIFSR